MHIYPRSSQMHTCNGFCACATAIIRNCCSFVARISIKGLCKLIFHTIDIHSSCGSHSCPIPTLFCFTLSTVFWFLFLCHFLFSIRIWCIVHRQRSFVISDALLYIVCHPLLIITLLETGRHFFHSNKFEKIAKMSEKCMHSCWYSFIRLITFYFICFTAFHPDCAADRCTAWAPERPISNELN